MSTLTFTGTLTIEVCWCGIHHAVPSDLVAHQLQQFNNGEKQMGIYCPLGHSWIRTGKGQAERERERAAEAERRLANLRISQQATRDQLAATERSNAALRGHLTRWRKRVANGVCPVATCKRHFPNVQAHVATQHPDWLAEHPEVFDA